MTKPDDISHSAAQFSKEKLCGLLLPITTPFHDDGELDLEGLRANIRKWNELGIAGYVVLGSTGERVHLDEREYLQVIETARQEVSSDLTFIAGVGQQSTIGTIREIRRVASAVSVDAVLVITPSFYRTSITQEALIRHYETVADESPVPIILYSMPALTGITIETEIAARLSQHENIVGIKDSSANVDGLRNTVAQVDVDFAVLTGNGTVLADSIIAGACGAILAVGCVAPALCLEIMQSLKQGKIDRAVELQTKLTPLATAVTTRFGIGGLKAALEIKGYVGGRVRALLRDADESASEEIAQKLAVAEGAVGSAMKSSASKVLD